MQEGMVVIQNFTGCIENFYLNSTNLFEDVKEAFEYGEALRYDRINTHYTCPVSSFSNINTEESVNGMHMLKVIRQISLGVYLCLYWNPLYVNTATRSDQPPEIDCNVIRNIVNEDPYHSM